MKRRLLNFLTLVSLLLCAGFVALWVRSHLRLDRARGLRYTTRGDITRLTEWTVSSPRGTVQIEWQTLWMRHPPEPDDYRSGRRWWETRNPVDPGFGPLGLPTPGRVGFSWKASDFGPLEKGISGKEFDASFPIWSAVLLFALLPAARAWRRFRRVPAGHCGGCGYDLTANESGVCPECGRATVAGARSRGLSVAEHQPRRGGRT